MSKNDENIEFKNSRSFEVYKDFDEMNLHDDLLRGIYSWGFDHPSGIQQRAIVPIINGIDIIAQAQSGTGKTGAFSIGVLGNLNYSSQSTQAIIVAPTRELVHQIYLVISGLSKHLPVNIMYVIGGTEVTNDIKSLKQGANIIVGTPGRLFDLIDRGYIYTSSVKTFIIDEADQMLSSDFKDQIHRILKRIPSDSQIGIFSATLPNPVMKLANHIMRDPIQILVKADELTLEGIKQYYVDVNCEDWKYDVLCDIYQSMNICQAIIYVNTQKKCDILYERLCDNNFAVSRIHGKMDQTQRNEIMKNFRGGTTRVLLTTDLLARGIDVQQVSLVINYDIPNDLENYLHRIGRTGRYGKKGVAINFITKDDYSKVKEIEKYYSTQLEALPSNLESLAS